MKFWSYIVSFLSGVISGLILFLKLDGPETTIHENTRIGKMKQRGNGNTTSLTIDKDELVTAKMLRQKQREEWRLLRQMRRRERGDRREA